MSKPRKSKPKPYTPSPAEIRAVTAAIRQSWTDAEEEARSRLPKPAPVSLEPITVADDGVSRLS